MNDLKLIIKKLDLILARVESNDWFFEKDGLKEVGIPQKTLSAWRGLVEHKAVWKYLPSPKGTDSKGRTMRRGIKWSRSYIESLYRQIP